MPAIEIQDLWRTYPGGVEAVAGVSLEVGEGEIFAFLGPNGAGKTTTVRMLVTLLKPTRGTARVAGFDVVRQADEVRRHVGVALQEAALDPLMTGAELLSLQATLQRLERDDERDRTLLDEVGLSEAADRRVSTYSGGMRRRLDLALALVHEPPVLFLDEPTTGLDPTSRVAIWERVRELSRRGTTVFLTTQYLEEADKLADRVTIIDRGRIVAAGTPEQLKAEAGRPRLDVTLTDGTSLPVGELLARFGEPLPSDNGGFSLALGNGARDVAPIVRALDEAGVGVQSIELIAPSLDDVFVAKTGRRLEGARTPEGASG
jgi:ABC-2 type transport system ATP-binding protein